MVFAGADSTCPPGHETTLPTTGSASLPLTLIIVTAPVPGTVAGATMVSSNVEQSIFLSFLARNYDL
jgi:hypothetical protein